MGIAEWFNAAILLATIAAIIYGPIKAVKITREMDDRKAQKERKFSLFRNLMRTRQVQLDAEHVFSLNLVEIEFHGDKNVIQAYRSYINHLSSPLPAVDVQQKYYDDRKDLFIDLLHEMGKTIGYDFDRRDLAKFGYAPVGWGNDIERQKYVQSLLIEVLEYKRPFPVAHMILGPNNPFPPPPDPQNGAKNT